MYVAGQIPGKTYHRKVNLSKKKIKDLLFFKLDYKKLCFDMYTVHYYGIEHLINKFGESKIITLFNSYSSKMRRKEFESNFKKIYKIDYDYFLNEVVDMIYSKNGKQSKRFKD